MVRRTFLAVGFAVLVSMMLAPHGGKQGIEGWGPFFSANGFHVTSGGIWYGYAGRVMIDMLALEMVFLAVLFAVVVNIRWRWRWKIGQPLKENPSHQEKPLQARDWLSPAGVFAAAVIAVAVLTILYGLVRTALQR
jgi:hypothetical protein